MRINCRTLLLIFYSLAPGFSKVLEESLFFVFGLISFILYIIICRGMQKNHGKGVVFLYLSLFLILFNSVFISIFTYFYENVSMQSIFYGFSTFLLPIFLGFTLSKYVNDKVLEDIKLVGIINCAVAIIIYPSFYFLYPHSVSDIFSKITEGVAAYRLSSVSGSLGFGPLVIMTLCLALWSLHKHSTILKYIVVSFVFLCAALNMQRSVWLSCLFICFFYIFFIRGGFKKAMKFYLVILLSSFFLFSFISSAHNDFEQVLEDRFSSLSGSSVNPIDERSEQWLGLIDNIKRFPTGTGVGQVGQVNRQVESNLNVAYIYDGDYFRIISEMGFSGFLLLFFVIFSPIVLFSKKIISSRIRNQLFLNFHFCILVCFLIQMIGTNITEMYYVNSLIWTFVFLAWNGSENFYKKLVNFPIKEGNSPINYCSEK